MQHGHWADFAQESSEKRDWIRGGYIDMGMVGEQTLLSRVRDLQSAGRQLFVYNEVRLAASFL